MGKYPDDFSNIAKSMLSAECGKISLWHSDSSDGEQYPGYYWSHSESYGHLPTIPDIWMIAFM
jgi:hypothetical protein